MAATVSVGRAFASYRKRVIPEAASAIQVEECRRAFYGGASIMLLYLSRALTTDDQQRLIRNLQTECDAFIAELVRTDDPAVH